MMYKHVSAVGEPLPLPVGKVVCVGRNYVDHIRELNNTVPSEPVLFMKPATALCDLSQPICIPSGQGECHNEVEVAVLIGAQLSNANQNEVSEGIAGVGIGLDLTLRDVQNRLKTKGLPWERAKAFDGSCPLSGFVDIKSLPDLNNLSFSLSVDGELRQSGNTANMLYDIHSLLIEISQAFTLLPGDVVLTGTPAGVAPLLSGNLLHIKLHDSLSIRTQVR